MNGHFFMPARLWNGENVLLHQADLFYEAGSRAFIVTSSTAAKKSGAFAELMAALGKNKIESAHFDGISPNPLFFDCKNAAQSALKMRADFVVGIGGGSALDAAKAVAVLAKNPDLTEEDFFDGKFTEALPLFLVSTMAGSGTEVTKIAVITSSKNHKKSVSSPLLFAKASFCDPRYTVTLSESYTFSGMLDAFCHAIESYFSKQSELFSELFALEALKRLTPLLSDVCRFGFKHIGKMERELICEAAIFAGFAINETGTLFPHPMGYLLTEDFSVPHGYACAYFMPAFIRWCEEKSPEKTKKLLRELNLEALSEITERVSPLLETEMSLKGMHINPDVMVRRVKNARGVIHTPGDLNEEAIRLMLDALS